jgi:hypothetical protein
MAKDIGKNREATVGRGPRGYYASGNPGRPKGSKNKTTVIAEALLDGEAKKLTRKCIDLALAGDTTALKLCMERILPPRKDRPVAFNLPDTADAGANGAGIMSAVLSAVATGALTPGEGGELAKIVSGYVSALVAGEFEQRLRALEEKA